MTHMMDDADTLVKRAEVEGQLRATGLLIPRGGGGESIISTCAHICSHVMRNIVHPLGASSLAHSQGGL